MTPQPQSPPAGDELDEIFSILNGSGAHACYCERSVDGGCKCALKDEYLVEAKAQLRAYILAEVQRGRLVELDLLEQAINDGSVFHFPFQCPDNPKNIARRQQIVKQKPYKPTRQKPIRRVGRYTLKWIECRAEWVEENGDTHPCHYCGIRVSDDTFLLEINEALKLTLDHTEARSRRPEFRFDKKKLVPACGPCNTDKGSLSHDEYVHECHLMGSPALSPAGA